VLSLVDAVIIGDGLRRCKVSIMLTVIIIPLASIVALFWLGPWLVVLIGGKPFMAILAILAVLVGWFGLWWYLIPLCLAFLGATVSAHWMVTRR